MSRNIGIFDTSVGIQNVLLNELENATMPKARPLAANVMSDIGLEDLYMPGNAARMIETALCPEVGDGKVLRPDIFSALLRGGFEALSESKNPDVRAFLRKDLAPMLEDSNLLQAYTGLMVGG